MNAKFSAPLVACAAMVSAVALAPAASAVTDAVVTSPTTSSSQPTKPAPAKPTPTKPAPSKPTKPTTDPTEWPPPLAAPVWTNSNSPVGAPGAQFTLAARHCVDSTASSPAATLRFTGDPISALAQYTGTISRVAPGRYPVTVHCQEGKYTKAGVLTLTLTVTGAPTKPSTGSKPIVAKPVAGQQVLVKPKGAADTGDGSTAGDDVEQGLFAGVGALAVLGGVATVATRRRKSGQNS